MYARGMLFTSSLSQRLYVIRPEKRKGYVRQCREQSSDSMLSGHLEPLVFAW